MYFDSNVILKNQTIKLFISRLILEVVNGFTRPGKSLNGIQIKLISLDGVYKDLFKHSQIECFRIKKVLN
ncbi:hypothetical protein JCM30760_24300 [Thiomicrorhabdus hydrogeniphila]